MKRLMYTTFCLVLCLCTCNIAKGQKLDDLTAGAHLIKARKNFNASFIISATSAALGGMVLLSNDELVGEARFIISTGIIISSITTLSGYKHIGLAGVKLNQSNSTKSRKAGAGWEAGLGNHGLLLRLRF